MKSVCSSWIALLLAAGCSSDDAPDDPPDAAPLDAAALDAALLDAALLDAALPDAIPYDCRRSLLPAVVDSVIMGSTPPSGDVADIVPWQAGDVVQLVYGGQGSLMLVAEMVASGSGLTAEEYLSFYMDAEIDAGGEGASRQPRGNAVAAAEDGSWYRETVFLPFEVDYPEEGDTLEVRVKVGCVEVERTVIAHLPEE